MCVSRAAMRTATGRSRTRSWRCRGAPAARRSDRGDPAERVVQSPRAASRLAARTAVSSLAAGSTQTATRITSSPASARIDQPVGDGVHDALRDAELRRAPGDPAVEVGRTTVALFRTIVAGRTAFPAPRHAMTGAWPGPGDANAAAAAAAVGDPRLPMTRFTWLPFGTSPDHASPNEPSTWSAKPGIGGTVSEPAAPCRSGPGSLIPRSIGDSVPASLPPDGRRRPWGRRGS